MDASMDEKDGARPQTMQDRRTFLKTLLGASVAVLPGCGRGSSEAPLVAEPDRRPSRSRVAVLPAADYREGLCDTVLRGFALFGLDPRGLRVVLKPNLVEFDPNGVINTHPAVIAATVDALLSLGAAQVTVAEGPGHRRDNEYILTASGVLEVLRERQVRYVDLNFDRVSSVALGSGLSGLGRLHLPTTVLEADLLISMPKLKTHHWAGVTLSMKNLFGIVPSAIYGWPKNVLHWAGIDQSIVDINSTISMRRFALVDGIVGMEGNGPIQGEARPAGVLVFGDDFIAVDASCARLMRIDPEKVRHLAWAGSFLGNLAEERIDQLGELPSAVQSDFRVLPRFEHIKV